MPDAAARALFTADVTAAGAARDRPAPPAPGAGSAGAAARAGTEPPPRPGAAPPREEDTGGQGDRVSVLGTECLW